MDRPEQEPHTARRVAVFDVKDRHACEQLRADLVTRAAEINATCTPQLSRRLGTPQLLDGASVMCEVFRYRGTLAGPPSTEGFVGSFLSL
jgi:hypothetical protein